MFQSLGYFSVTWDIFQSLGTFFSPLGYFSATDWGYFSASGDIFQQLGIFFSHMGYFSVTWVIFQSIGTFFSHSGYFSATQDIFLPLGIFDELISYSVGNQPSQLLSSMLQKSHLHIMVIDDFFLTKKNWETSHETKKNGETRQKKK